MSLQKVKIAMHHEICLMISFRDSIMGACVNIETLAKSLWRQKKDHSIGCIGATEHS